jgi:energy-converting hydrogenase Eha subunit A
VYWDDNLYIFENSHIRSLDAAFFRWAFLDFPISNWHPLTWISHALDYTIWGLYPLGHHLTSILLHAINTGLVVVLVLKLLEIAREGSQRNPSASFLTDRATLIAAGVTGLLFGIHPVHVESVAWVSERKDLLCALFFLLSIMTYTDYAVRRRSEGEGKDESGRKNFHTSKQYFLALGFFVLALMSKPMAVTLPVVLVILDWYPLNRIRSLKTLRTAGVEKIPFFALSIVSSVITMIAQKAGKSIVSLDFVPLSSRILVAVQSLVAYLGKMLLPVDLVPLYPYPRAISLFSFEYLAAIVLVLGITAFCVVLARKQRVWLSAWGYYVLTLIPVLGIVQVGNQAMADRYTYLPSLGPFLIVGLCAAGIGEMTITARRGALFTKAIGGITALLLVIGLSFLTMQQIAIWKNSLGLWNYVIGKEPERFPLAYNNRGMVFLKAGQFDMAIADFNKAVALDPQYAKAYYNRGSAFDKIGRLDEAILDYKKTIALDPLYYEAYYYLEQALKRTGQAGKQMRIF